MGVAAFRKTQLGLESTRGTPVAATSRLSGFTVRADLNDREIVQPEDENGSLALAHRSYVPYLFWESELEGAVTFEDLPYLLGMAIRGGVSPTTPGGTTPRLWTYEPTLEAAQNPNTYTLEFGDDTQEYEAEYVFATNLELSGALDDALMARCALVGRQLTASTFTGALANRTLRTALSAQTRLTFDDSGGTIGTTFLAATLLDWTWRLPAHFVVKRHQDGSKLFTSHGEVKMRPELELTAEFTSGVATLRTKYAAETRQLVRLRSTGENIESTFDRWVTIDGAYKIVKFAELDERNGASIVQMTLHGEYDITWAKLFQITVQNNIAALP